MKNGEIEYIRTMLDTVLTNQAFIIARLDEAINLASIAVLHQLPQQERQPQPQQESRS